MADQNAPTTKKRLTAAERREQALQRRIGGWTFQRIGDELGITRQSAHNLVITALKDLNEKVMESAAELQRLELERLDTMNNAIWGAVLKGDVGAIDRAIRIQARRAALLGLDAPKKTDITSIGERITTDNETINESISSLAEALGNIMKDE